jgi:hypothetical protein
MHGAEYYKPKTWIQASNKTQPWWTQTQQSNWKMKIVALGDIEQWKVYNFFGFFGGAWYKEKKLITKHMIIPHGQLEIWYHLMRG